MKILDGFKFRWRMLMVVILKYVTKSFVAELIAHIGSVHIDIQFQSRHHGDADSFDGRGGVGKHQHQHILTLRFEHLKHFQYVNIFI